MPWLVDGSNVLGVMRVDRHSDEAKRGLMRLLASFARTKKARVTCFFDGHEPSSFGRSLGAVTAVFSESESADALIVRRSAGGRGWNVVTADRELASRIERRGVRIIAPTAFIREMELATSENGGDDEDWMRYFSDPENRIRF